MNSEHPNTENRRHKDSLFVDYFSKDRDWKQHFLSLYNALHGTDLQVETTRLERVNLEQVLYMDYYNDIAVMVNDQFILMIEHQSTINPNMPLRLLEYVTRIYGNMIDSKSKFSNQLIPLAKPEFVVFYTGNQNLPPESYLHLSDAFKLNHNQNSELTLELKVKVCKIIGKESSQIVSQCSDLDQYVQFLKLIDEAKSDGQAQPLTRAIQKAVRCDVLKNYLERKGGEALSILMTEYDYATDIAIKQEEAYASGRNEGILLGLERGRDQGAHQKALETAQKLIARGYPADDIADLLGLTISQIQEIQ
ncbi:MAG: Rpn family recombination-promoting nuclease/putative transposase [Treponema sp.]|nr:Rpn family recombination-promoting nuclease/putative transposase [Treponema sp.]